MSRNSKFTPKEKREFCRLHLEGSSANQMAQNLGINVSTLYQWTKEYLFHGEQAFERPSGNRSYPAEFKEQVVEEYYREKISMAELAGKYQLRHGVIAGWIRKWDNKEELKDYHLYPGVHSMNPKKTTPEERLQMVQWILEHDKDYTAAATLFQVKYATLYAWTQRFLQEGEAGLDRKRGRKPKEPVDPSSLSEVERLKLELEEQRKLNVRLDLETRLLKKKDEILRQMRSRK